MNEKNFNNTRPPFSGPFRFCKVGSSIRSEYRLSRPDADGVRELVEVGKVDLREVVQSNYQNSFDAILDRFLDTGDLPEGRSFHEDQDFLLDALDVMSDYNDFMESAREMYNFSPDLSYSEIRKQLQDKLEEVNKNIKNGGIENAQKNQASQNAQPEEVQQTVPEHGENN